MNALKDIYFYNAMGLALDIKKGALSEYIAIKHLIALTILAGIGFDVPVGIEDEVSSGPFSLLSLVAMFIVHGIISYFGIWLAYQVNAKGDGKDFFMRFAVLTLPIGIQLMVLFLWVGLVLAVVTASLVSSGMPVFSGMSVAFMLLSVVFVVLFYKRMRLYIAIAAGVED